MSANSSLITFNAEQQLKENPVISKDINGSVISRLDDNIIDLSPYSNSASKYSSKFNFQKVSPKYRGQIKNLWYILFKYGKGKNNNNLSVSTLYKVFNEFLYKLSLFSVKNDIEPIKVLSNEKNMFVFIKKNANSRSFLKTAQSSLSLFHSHPQQAGFIVSFPEVLSQYIANQIKLSDAHLEQTVLIPPRLYTGIISQSWNLIYEHQRHHLKITSLIIKMLDRRASTSKAHNRKISYDFESLGPVIYGYIKKQTNGIRGFIKYLTAIMGVCKNLIQIYSGMRSNEVLSLNSHCLSLDMNNIRPKARIIGNTTKYIGNKKVAQWVTSSEIEHVVSLLHSITRPIAEKLPNVSFSPTVPKDKVPCPLFLSIQYLKQPQYLDKKPLGAVGTLNTSLTMNGLYDYSEFIISESDSDFMQKVEPERDWQNSIFATGFPFPFKGHQFRRSLAVYSAQSGLVSIGSLQNQLKHLCQEVSFYYRNGAENAKGLFDIPPQNHIGDLYNKLKPESDFLAYLFEIIYSEEKLLGIQGRAYQNLKNKSESHILSDRKHTLKQFNNGSLAYETTSLGGCSSIEPCNKRLTRTITACISCEHATIKLSRVQRAIETLSIYLDDHPTTSVEYRSEKSELEALISFRDKKRNILE